MALVGPSGCGKTTALRLLGQVERPDAGFIEAQASGATSPSWLPVHDAPTWRDRVAVCWQEPGLLSSSIRDNLLVTARTSPGARFTTTSCAPSSTPAPSATASRARPPVAQSDDPLDVTLSEGAASISAGERQRLALARTLLRVRVAAAPIRLVLLDEAAANLDAETAHAVLSCVLDELRRHPEPPAVVLVSHQPEHAALTDRTVRLGARPAASARAPSGDGRAGAVPTLTP